MKKLAAIFLIMLLCSGCATTGIRLAEKKETFTRNKDKGFVFFKLDCVGMTMPVAYLYLKDESASNSQKKPIVFALRERGSFNGNFKYDPTYFLLEMHPGKWHIVHVSNGTEGMMAGAMFGLVGYATYKLIAPRPPSDIDISFTVEEGKISYIGTLKVFKAWEIIDEQDEAHNALKESYPNINEQIEPNLALINKAE